MKTSCPKDVLEFKCLSSPDNFFLIYCRIKEDVNVKGSGALYKTSVGVSDMRNLRELKQRLRRRQWERRKAIGLGPVYKEGG